MGKIMGYDRFLDIHITHNGAYDFADDVASQLEYQRRRWGFPTTLNLTRWGGGKDDDLANGFDLGGIDRGYAAVAVELKNMKGTVEQRGARDLLAWVGDVSRRGKIRINVHGDGEGNIAMQDRYRQWLHAPGEQIGHWLHANGLPVPTKGEPDAPRGGLNTLSMALCMAARGGPEFASLDRPATEHARAAVGSVVQRCVLGLREHGYRGVEVTSSNELVANSRGQIGRSIILPEDWEIVSESDTARVLKIPGDLKVDAARRVIEIPQSYDVATFFSERWRQNGWVLRHGREVVGFIPVAGWYVEPGADGGGVIHPPVGWFPVATEGGGGTITFELKKTDYVGSDIGGYEHVWLRLAHTPEKARDFS